MENIEKIIKMDPNDLFHIFRFVSSILNWNRGEFIKVMGSVVEKRISDKNLFSIRIKPNFLVVPMYSYFFASQMVMKDLGFEIAYDDTIDIEKISQFKIVGIPDKADVTISVSVGPGVGGFSSAMLRALGIRFSIKDKFGKDGKSLDISAYFWDKRDYEILKMELETLKESQGESFYKVANFIDPRAALEIYGIEKSMFTILNFIYALYTGEYTGEFGKEDPQVGLLTSFAEIIRNCGKTFEEVLDSIKVASVFM